MGEAALDWWDLDPSVPIYKNEQGVVYKQLNWTSWVVLFDAQGLASLASGGRTWGDVDEVKGYCDPDNREWEDEDQPVHLDNLPSTHYPLSDDQYEAHDERAGRRSRCVVCPAPFSVREARLRMLSEGSPQFRALQDRSVPSVVESDNADPRCQPIRVRLQEEFAKVFTFPDDIRTVNPSKRGKYGVASISLKSGAKPQRVTPYRAVGLRAAAFRELIAQFSRRGMLEPSSSVWAARASCVPKPGGKWRLVIDYRYLNSQIDDEQFALPVIDDMFLKQSKNAIWSIFDLEDGFQQMHLDEASRPLTAFVTPWGLFQWTVLPMGLKMAPQKYQCMVSDCLSSFGLEPYIDNLIFGTPDTEDNPDLDALVTDCCLR